MSLVLEPLNSLGHFFPPSNYVLEPGDAPFPTGASFLPPLKRYAGWLQPGQLPIPKAIPLSHTHTLALEGCGTVPYLWTIVGGGAAMVGGNWQNWNFYWLHSLEACKSTSEEIYQILLIDCHGFFYTAFFSPVASPAGRLRGRSG